MLELRKLETTWNEADWPTNVQVNELKVMIKRMSDLAAITVDENIAYTEFIEQLIAKGEEERLAEREYDNKGGSYKNRSRSRGSSGETTAFLSIEQKCYIARSQFEEYKQKLYTLTRASDKLIQFLNATLEEFETRADEHARARHVFETIVVKNGYDVRTKSFILEKFSRYNDELNKQRDGLIDKLRLLNTTQRTRAQRLTAQLRRKEHLGEFLNAIDFQQQKAENNHCLAKIDEKNKETIKLKKLCGFVKWKLSAHKVELAHELEKGIRVRKDLQQRKEFESKVMDESEKIQSEMIYERENRRYYLHILSSHQGPSISSYTSTMQEEKVLTRKNAVYARKQHTAEVSWKAAVKEHKKLWMELGRGGIDLET